jgi:uncharacterized protein GlcG (DUF336 family)
MTDKRARVPGPDHPITIERNPARVVVVVAGRIVADTCDAVTLREASYAAVQYVPRKDVDVAILDDGGNLKAFSRMDGASIPTIEIAQNKAYTALFGVPTQDFFDFIQRDPSLLAGIPTLARVAAWGGGLPIKVNGEVIGAIGVSGAPTVQNDVDCASAAIALVPEP